MAYLITCAGFREERIDNNPSISHDKLSFNDELVSARQEIIRISYIELDWDKTRRKCKSCEITIFKKE